ncbi:AI-2E family transporter [Serinicoccus sp. CNJ-927]|uniref:AI-2E family transporter n=1 Tax=Serinicoccus sp. CNJ-927 TaxID=1904970 RepID=UPI001EDAEC1D|nr:AI-2E family transporter [Serinicoccus sp. CNJ-927]
MTTQHAPRRPHPTREGRTRRRGQDEPIRPRGVGTEAPPDGTTESDETTPEGRAARLRRAARAVNPAAAPRAGVRAVQRWQAFRVRQRELLDESNRLQSELWAQIHAGAPAATAPDTAPASGRAGREPSVGPAGRRGEEIAGRSRQPMLWASPFSIGFTGALGVLLAWLLVQNLTRLSSVLTYLLVAVFLTLALNPLVEGLTRRGVSRPSSVFVVFMGFVTVVAVSAVTLLPGVVAQAVTLVERAPQVVEELAGSPWLVELDARYAVSERATTELDRLLTERGTWTTLFGGVLGAAGWVAGSLVGVLTSAILTLYLLATLPAVKDGAYRLVPASRRPGVVRLAEEIMRRVGGYALGQATVATINAVCSWLMMQVLGIPYAAILAVSVGLLGLIPLIGATLGAVIVALSALTLSPTLALVVLVYYVIYQQLENYWIVPRIMKRTVSVPGAVTVVAVLAGGTLLGVLGALIAIPVAAGLLLVYEEVLIPRQEHL